MFNEDPLHSLAVGADGMAFIRENPQHPLPDCRQAGEACHPEAKLKDLNRELLLCITTIF
ncbi:MAG: hypothetical protein K0B08_05910 [Bacteroidales bacterium]|nr:hypothetical protein [Bacteroidales bacterium]